VHCLNYKGVVEDYENVCSSVLLNEFELDYYDRKVATKLHVFQNDLKKGCLKAKYK